jgi:SAM-dependent methyltransferase
VSVDERSRRIAAVGYDYAAHELELVTACNLCGSTRHVEVSRVDRYGYPARFRVCARCGLGFISPRLSAADYGRFYDGVYRPLVSAYHGRLIDAKTVQVEQRDYADELMSFLRAHLAGTPAGVLDIGGSTGIVAGAVRDAFGTAATVLDPAPDELAVAAAAGMETIEGFAEDYDPGDRRWELVLLCQTIDHLLDVRSTVDAIRRVLADDGRAFVDVLDVEFMARRRGSIEGAVKIDHPYYLTRDTARAYFERSGLAVVAERLSDDGHWGFLLEPAEPREPDWEALRRRADELLATLWRLRAG